MYIIISFASHNGKRETKENFYSFSIFQLDGIDSCLISNQISVVIFLVSNHISPANLIKIVVARSIARVRINRKNAHGRLLLVFVITLLRLVDMSCTLREMGVAKRESFENNVLFDFIYTRTRSICLSKTTTQRPLLLPTLGTQSTTLLNTLTALVVNQTICSSGDFEKSSCSLW